MKGQHPVKIQPTVRSGTVKGSQNFSEDANIDANVHPYLTVENGQNRNGENQQSANVEERKNIKLYE